jgi:quinol monooxygenase YgiN
MPQISRATLETGGKLPEILVYLLCVKPGYEEMVHDELLTLRRKSRLEAGCFHFDLYRLEDSRFYFLLHEVWENQDALEAHTTSRHSTQFRATVMRYLEQPIAMYQLQEVI